MTVVDVGAEDAPSLAQALDGAAGVIDALLGTGFSGAPREPISGAIAAINAARERRPAPARDRLRHAQRRRWLDRRDQRRGGACRRTPSPFMPPSRASGSLPASSTAARCTSSTSASPQPTSRSARAIGLIGAAVRDEIPRRHAGSTKFSAGSVLVVGGSRGLTGAPVLAALAAARAGAGYVTVAAPASVAPTIAGKLLEVMTVELPDDPETGPERGSSRMAVERAARTGALVLGPGIGRLPAAQKFARDVAAHAKLPLVLDADGLNAHAEEEPGSSCSPAAALRPC